MAAELAYLRNMVSATPGTPRRHHSSHNSSMMSSTQGSGMFQQGSGIFQQGSGIFQQGSGSPWTSQQQAAGPLDRVRPRSTSYTPGQMPIDDSLHASHVLQSRSLQAIAQSH